MDLTIAPGPGFSLDARGRSGAVAVEGERLEGSLEKHEAQGAIGGGGPLVRIRTGSGAIRVRDQ